MQTPHSPTDKYLRDLAMNFESLGGTGHGCEFGLFQREVGAEPMGLLRWSDLGPDQLCAALESEFEGVGERENTIVFEVNDLGRPEYWTRDRRHHMAMRCFIYPDQVPYNEMVAKAEKRLKFLSNKLIQDLKSASKIFVYKNMLRNLTETEVLRLYTAVRSYGNNTLFYIRYSDDDHLPGTVEAFQGLIIGYTHRFTHTPRNDNFLGHTYDILRELCGAAFQFWASGVTGTKDHDVLWSENAVPVASRVIGPDDEAENWESIRCAKLLGREWINAGENALGFLLGEGWSGSEPWGVWGVSDTHVMNFWMPSIGKSDLRLEADVHAYLAGDQPEQEVRVYAGEQELAVWRFDESNNRGVRSVIVPAETDNDNGGLPMTFLRFKLRSLHPNPGRPSARNGSSPSKGREGRWKATVA